MGCAASCLHRSTMFFTRSNCDNETRIKLERKLYIAKESPEPDFDLSDCQLMQVPSGIFAICKVYRKTNIYLNNNNLQTLDDGGQISDLYLTKVLNLSFNKFCVLPLGLANLVNLSELYLEQNHIQFIPEAIQNLACLEILDLSKNNIQKLTPALGKLKFLRILKLRQNPGLTALCTELCYVSKLNTLEIDGDQFIFPPPEIATQSTINIMTFLCKSLNIDYDKEKVSNNRSFSISPTSSQNPFEKHNKISWEDQEAAIFEQENRFHQTSKKQREDFLSKVLLEQQELDSEIAKVQEARDIDRQRLIKAIQNDEKEIEQIVNNFIQSEYFKPEVLQQQLAHEQAEHDHMLAILRRNYDNIRKTDVLCAMESLLEEDYKQFNSKLSYKDTLNNFKQEVFMHELDGTDKIEQLLRAKDESHSVLVQQLLEDQDVQKTAVAALMEKVDARSWSLKQEINLISSHIARLSMIEQEKKKMDVFYNYNELLHQRIQLVNLLDDLLQQQNKRRCQLIETLKEMEYSECTTSDFWLKNYQKLIESAPKTLLDLHKNLDPLFANYLLQEGAIHCLPFLVKFIFSGKDLMNVTSDNLKENGVTLTSDREAILRAINYYVKEKNCNQNYVTTPSAPPLPAEEMCTGVVQTSEEESVTIDSECVVCLDAKCEIIFVPCGHLCCCKPCGDKGLECCPMCRTTIERAIKVMFV